MSAAAAVAERRFVLPADVQLVVATEDDAAAFAEAGLRAGEVAVVRPGSRERPRVVPAEAAALLELFRRPLTVGEAVLEHCARWGGDPGTTLEEAFPVLVELSRAELLAVDGTESARALAARLTAGDTVGPVTVTEPIRVVRDGEVWRARQRDGASAAVKVVASGALGRSMLARELTALDRLRHAAPGLAPTVLAHVACPDGEDPSAASGSLALTWVEGLPVDAVAHRMAAVQPLRVNAPSEQPVRALVVAVAEAYARLHESGVVHGDVHPGNVLVGTDGTVTLVDFGLARIEGTAFADAPRAVGGEYLDPETAAAILAEDPLPQVSAAAEQYSVAALLWRLLTCGPALTLAPDRTESMRLVCTQRPQSLVDCGAAPWPAGEAALRRALAKAPHERYPSLRGLVLELRAAANASASASAPAGTGGAGTSLRQPDGTCDLRRFEIGGQLWERATPALATDLAQALAELAERSADPDAADLARVWSLR